MIGLTNLWSDARVSMPPKLNTRRAVFVLGKIDEILAWDKDRDRERDTRFVELGRYLCEVRARQYWRLDRMKCFDEFLERRFPDSRRKAYYLMAVHEHLSRIPKQRLREVGWTKATELVKVVRKDGDRFDSDRWISRAQSLPKEGFKQEVARYLTGRESEAWELLYFKVYQSQLRVIEQALEIAGQMLGTDRSRGYCLEMICADFLAGAQLQDEVPDALLLSVQRLVEMLPQAQRQSVLQQIEAKI